MPLPDRTQLRRRLTLVVAILVVAVAALAVMLASNRRVEPPPVTSEPQPRALDINPPPLPLPDPPLSRADLIAAASRAGSAHATGEPAPAQNAELVGRRFILKIPFGCEGARPDDGVRSGAYWTHDTRQGAITLRAYPENWTTTPWVRELAGSAGVDAVEGFWIPRPWITSESCPRATQAQGEKTVGLAMFFEPNSSRVLRRGSRPYEFTGKAPADGAPVAPEGFRLVLAGRITGFDGGEPVRCRDNPPQQRPVCLIAVAFDQVAFEDPATGETLAEWRMN